MNRGKGLDRSERKRCGQETKRYRLKTKEAEQPAMQAKPRNLAGLASRAVAVAKIREN